MATIHDVARIAGVSITTVSRVLNGVAEVRAETEERVRRAAAELNFRPNALARGLITRQTSTIGLVVPDITNPGFPVIARGAEIEAHERGYSLILCNSDGDVRKESQQINLLLQKQVDGILLAGTGSPEEEADILRNIRTPVVLVSREGSPDFSAVVADTEHGAYLAARRLLELGHRSIAFIAGPEEIVTTRLRYAGYRRALLEAGTEVDPSRVSYLTYDRQGGYKATQYLLRSNQPRPQAIFAGNDLMAVGAIQALAEAGYRVPQDVAVVGFGDMEIASLVSPTLTTVAMPFFRMGKTATRLLLDQIDKKASRPRRIVLGVHLVPRQSCGGSGGDR